MRMRLLGVLGAMVIGGCGGPPRAVVVNPAPPPVYTNQGSEVALSRTLTMLAGTKLKIHFFAPINPDCTPVAAGAVRAVRQPTQGTLTIVRGEDFQAFPAINPRSACNTRRVPGTLVEYQARPGFRGTDTFAYDVFNTAGGALHYTVTINVQ